MRKPILYIEVAPSLSYEELEGIRDNAFRTTKEDYHIVIATGVQDPQRPRVLSCGFFQRLFDYLDQRKQRRHDIEIDRLRNKLHAMTEKCERIARERDYINSFIAATQKPAPVTVALQDFEAFQKARQPKV